MKKIIKQIVATDEAQKELVVFLGRMYDDWTPELYANKTFPNTLKGFMTLVAWVKKLTDDSGSLRYVLEATGVYHEPLAYFLDEKGYEVTIVFPNKISNYFKTLDVKTINDKTSAEAIAMFGLEKKLKTWKRPKRIFRDLRQLTRERDQIVQERTMVKNQLHAEKAEAEPNKQSIKRAESHVKMLDEQEKEIKQELSGELRFRYTTTPGRRYQLERSVTLAPASWSATGGAVMGDGYTAEFRSSPEAASVGFYRVVEVAE